MKQPRRLCSPTFTMLACVLGFFVLVISAEPVHAAPITISLTAQVREIGDNTGYLAGRIEAGDTITGWYSYDSATPNTSADGETGMYRYLSSPYGITLQVNGFSFRTGPDHSPYSVELGNDVAGGSRDFYQVRSSLNLFDLELPYTAGLRYNSILLALVDNSASALTGTALPLTPPLLSAFPDTWYGLQFHSASGGDTFVVRADLTSLTLAPPDGAVPEPATLLLLATGLGGAARYARRRR